MLIDTQVEEKKKSWKGIKKKKVGVGREKEKTQPQINQR